MSYLVNTPRAASLTINGADYTSNLIEFVVSDTSAYKNGMIITEGTVVLGQVPGGESIEDYDRNNFKRGTQVILDILMPDRSTVRHPRGLLYVASTTYDPSGPTLAVDVVCKLGLGALTDFIDNIEDLPELYLDPAQSRFENIGAALSAEGRIAWQDNTGAIQTASYFDGDVNGAVSSGDFVSILGVTTLEAGPLSTGSVLPDEIVLQYSYLDGTKGGEPGEKVDTVTTETTYPLKYPAKSYTRKGDGTFGSGTGITYSYGSSSPKVTSCGVGGEPAGNEDAACDDNYNVVSEPLLVNARKLQTSVTYYEGPGGQTSLVDQVEYGPAILLNNQYYADEFSWCRTQWSSDCLPNGGCTTERGMTEVLLYHNLTEYTYGADGEVKSVRQERWLPKLSLAETDDWRAGANTGTGTVTEFNDLTAWATQMIRVNARLTEYEYTSNGSIETTRSYRTTGGEGPVSNLSEASLDAYNGTLTTTKRTSKTTTTNPPRPDQITSPVSETAEGESKLFLSGAGYITPPNGAGPYIEEESVPVPLIFKEGSSLTVEDALSTYENYLIKFTMGDFYGVTVSESVREDIISGWSPNKAFRYADTKKNKILAMRMDSATWGVTTEEAVVSFNGIWLGTSNGTLTLPENLLGNSLPDMSVPSTGGGNPNVTPPPVPPGTTPTPPSIEDETAVVADPLTFTINVNLGFDGGIGQTSENSPIRPPLLSDADRTSSVDWTTIVWVEGISVEAGDLLGVNPDGSIPVSYLGSLVVADATTVNGDLFA